MSSPQDEGLNPPAPTPSPRAPLPCVALTRLPAAHRCRPDLRPDSLGGQRCVLLLRGLGPGPPGEQRGLRRAHRPRCVWAPRDRAGDGPPAILCVRPLPSCSLSGLCRLLRSPLTAPPVTWAYLYPAPQTGTPPHPPHNISNKPEPNPEWKGMGPLPLPGLSV